MEKNKNTSQRLIGNIICSIIISMVLFTSCKSKNYIDYYSRVNKADSILRFHRDSLQVVKNYRKIFRKFEPKNQERIQELSNYINISHRLNRNFGGKKTLKKYIFIEANRGLAYNKFSDIYKEYNLSEDEVQATLKQAKQFLNRRLVDSFSVAFLRDQEQGREVDDIMRVNDKKNADLLKWTLENHGYPSIQKIGVMGNKEVFMPMDNFLGHMIESEHYPYFEKELLKAVKNGDCPPRNYATMVDKYNLWIVKKETIYGAYQLPEAPDTISIDRKRREIGLPSLAHTRLITRDFFKK